MKKNVYTKNIITIAVFGAASIAGGLLKLPSPYGSIALDSFPGYFAAAFFNPVIGGIVGLIGHLGSAATGGFPLGGFHVWISIHMFLWCFIFGLIIRTINKVWAIIPATLIAIFLNGVISPMLLIPVGFDKKAAFGAMIFLVVASAINIILAALIVSIISRAKIKGI